MAVTFFFFFLLVKGNAYRLLLMADERSSKEGGEKKKQVEALSEVQLAVSNYRRADAFCTVNREETQSRDFHTHIGRFQLTALVLERCELYTKGEESAEERWADGRLDRGDGRRAFQSHSNDSCDVGGSLVAELRPGL